MGARETHSPKLFDDDLHSRSDSNTSVGTLREGTPLVKLRWIVAMGEREVHSTPLIDNDLQSRWDSNSSVGALREAPNPCNYDGS